MGSLKVPFIGKNCSHRDSKHLAESYKTGISNYVSSGSWNEPSHLPLCLGSSKLELSNAIGDSTGIPQNTRSNQKITSGLLPGHENDFQLFQEAYWGLVLEKEKPFRTGGSWGKFATICYKNNSTSKKKVNPRNSKASFADCWNRCQQER